VSARVAELVDAVGARHAVAGADARIVCLVPSITTFEGGDLINFGAQHGERNKHIVTLENPIEFLHRDLSSSVTQREIGPDTDSFRVGLRAALRQDPDVILLGEIRDRETMSIALMAADTGHLVLSTLHTVDAAQTVNRILSFYPPHQHAEIRYLLASTLQSVISLRLIPRAGDRGRVPACEVMVTTPTIKEYLMVAEKTHLIRSAIAEGAAQYGMQSFDQSLMRLYSQGLISYDEALRNSTTPSEFELRVKGIHASSDTTWDAFEAQKQRAAEQAAEPPPAEHAVGRVTKESGQGPAGISRF